MYVLISRLLPKKLKRELEELLEYSTIKIHKERFIGFVISFGFLLALTLSFYIGFLFKMNFLPIFLVLLVIIEVGSYLLLLIHTDKKAKYVEQKTYVETLAKKTAVLSVTKEYKKPIVVHNSSKVVKKSKETKKEKPKETILSQKYIKLITKELN